MATEKNYIYDNGQLVEDPTNAGMVGWEYVENGFTKRIVCESIGIYNHAKLSEAKYIIQGLIDTVWVDISRPLAIVSKNTYCNDTPPFAGVSESDAFETVDDVKQLKSGIVIEWDFYYPMFFNPLSSGANLYNFIKHGAEIKTGLSL